MTINLLYTFIISVHREQEFYCSGAHFIISESPFCQNIVQFLFSVSVCLRSNVLFIIILKIRINLHYIYVNCEVLLYRTLFLYPNTVDTLLYELLFYGSLYGCKSIFLLKGANQFVVVAPATNQ